MKITIEYDQDHPRSGSIVNVQTTNGSATMTYTRNAFGVSWLVKESKVNITRAEAEELLRDVIESFVKGVKT